MESLKGNSSEITNNVPLDYYPLDDGTYGVKAGNTLYLKEISIPEEYYSEGSIYGAFMHCRSLKEISFANGSTLTNIGDMAFC